MIKKKDCEEYFISRIQLVTSFSLMAFSNCSPCILYSITVTGVNYNAFVTI